MWVVGPVWLEWCLYSLVLVLAVVFGRGRSSDLSYAKRRGGEHKKYVPTPHPNLHHFSKLYFSLLLFVDTA